MAASLSVVAEGLASAAVAIRRLFRVFSQPVHTNTTDDIRLEEGVGSGAMDQPGEFQLRNRFSPGPQAYIPDQGEESSVTTAGALTPGSGDEPSSANDADDLKGSFFKIALRRLSTGFGSSTHTQETINKKDAFARSRGHHLFEKHRYEEYPEGFPRLAAWVSSDRDLEMTRGFKYLYQRTLVQDVVELNELEKELFEADKMEAAQPAPNFSLRHTREEQDGNTKHRELRETIRKALKKHKETAADFRELQSFGKPLRRNHETYYDWLWSNPQLFERFDDYLKHADDMVSLRADQLSFFDNFVEEHVHHFPISMFKGWLQPEEERNKTEDKKVTYRSETRRRILAGGLLVLTAVGTLVIPVFLLSLLSLSRVQMTVIASVFILAFAWILYVVEEGQVYRVLLGTATYSAILVVFLNINAVNFPSDALRVC
ncbi:hypothetical protein BKA61DRAFT_677320 [Leptodontidium sp. MPI-SDFR-AT-0119]|nr:hypothetical protein BKA61DRAFT_677320 [Leptodontidium sp. MPI-SDFR-AT-0119]